MNLTSTIFRLAAVVALVLLGRQDMAAAPGEPFSREMLVTPPHAVQARHPAPGVPLRLPGVAGAALASAPSAAAWLLAEAGDSTGTEKQEKKKSPTGAMVRSLLIPGWGQFYNGKYLKAIAVFAIETGIVANAIYLDRLANESTTEEEKAYYLDQRNARYWWLLLAKLLSMLDAYVDAQLADFDESPSLSIAPGVDLPAQGGYALRVGVKF
jgi:hypothetical protein